MTMDFFSAASQLNDTLVRRHGMSFIDGTIPGYALILGAETTAIPDLVKWLAERKILVFVTEDTLTTALQNAGITPSWETRIVTLDLPSALTFIAQVARLFSGLTDEAAVLQYARERLRGFTLLLGEPSAERLALAQSAMELGCPLLSTTDLGVNWRQDNLARAAVIDRLATSAIAQLGIEERGVRVPVAMPPLPVEYAPDFAGEIVRDAGADLHGVELVVTGHEIVDGQINLVGPDLDDDLSAPHPYGLLVQVSGRAMQPDFESVLERQIETVVNNLHGVMHRGQRTLAHLRISRDAIKRGLRLRQIGELVHAHFHNEFGAIVSRVQITFFTDPAQVANLITRAQSVYEQRDRRLAGLTDESVDTFYTCTLCQTIAAGHLCVISPEHPGVCGAQDWIDTRTAVNIRPVGPNRAVEKTGLLDARLGQWESIQQAVLQDSGGALNAYSLYSLMQDPATSCGDFECITAMLPLANGVMLIDRTFAGITPSGMDWNMLYEMIGNGTSTPGFLGHSKRLIASSKFIAAEGGWRRIVWMNHSLREEMRPALEALATTAGLDHFVDQIATEQDMASQEEIAAHLERVGHPALSMEPLM